MKPDRSEVDGTIPGFVMLVAADPNRGEEATPIHAVFTEATQPNPYEAAMRLEQSIHEDFPDHHFAVIMNQRARYLLARQRMQSLLGADVDYTVDDYLENA